MGRKVTGSVSMQSGRGITARLSPGPLHNILHGELVGRHWLPQYRADAAVLRGLNYATQHMTKYMYGLEAARGGCGPVWARRDAHCVVGTRLQCHGSMMTTHNHVRSDLPFPVSLCQPTNVSKPAAKGSRLGLLAAPDVCAKCMAGCCCWSALAASHEVL